MSCNHLIASRFIQVVIPILTDAQGQGNRSSVLRTTTWLGTSSRSLLSLWADVSVKQTHAHLHSQAPCYNAQTQIFASWGATPADLDVTTGGMFRQPETLTLLQTCIVQWLQHSTMRTSNDLTSQYCFTKLCCNRRAAQQLEWKKFRGSTCVHAVIPIACKHD